jgi:membrane-associated protein
LAIVSLLLRVSLDSPRTLAGCDLLMSWLTQILDIILHFNKYLGEYVNQFGVWIYLVLFLIIFCETGLVVTPFLPGDSLLFAVGALTIADGPLSLALILLLLTIAAILGDSLNYWIGKVLGERLFQNPQSRIFNHRHLERTHEFYEKHGGKTIILARFVPVIRTFAPFVAGMGAMTYTKFFVYNVVGGILWVFSLVLLGHFFGGLPVVKKNFSLVILAIIIISMIPPGIEFLRAFLAARRRATASDR